MERCRSSDRGIKLSSRNQVKRGERHREEKSVILIGAEGKNRTERIYFRELAKAHNRKYVVRFAKGNSTDPIGIVKDTIKDYEKECTDEGDMAFAVFDTDADENKQKYIDEAVTLAKRKGVHTVCSTPCFEVWYLMHFRYSTGPILSSRKVLEEMEKYVPGYEKSSGIYHKIRNMTMTAIHNAERIEAYHDMDGIRKKSIKRNPGTEVHEIVRILE